MVENLKIAIAASIDAGLEIMKIYAGEFNYELKDDNSPLTIADKNANDVINQYLIKTDIPIISEENAQIDYSVRKEWSTCWIVDPLDGTKEFIKRNGEFTVNIALIKNGKPILGVVYVPVEKKLYYADVYTMEAYSVILSDDLEFEEQLKNAIRVSPKRNENLIRVVGSRSHMNDETTNFVNKLKSNSLKVDIISKGSSLKFCLVAEGSADIYPRFAPTMEWDTAAAHAICSAAGVEVISHETKKPLSYNKKNLLNPWFLVSND